MLDPISDFRSISKSNSLNDLLIFSANFFLTFYQCLPVLVLQTEAALIKTLNQYFPSAVFPNRLSGITFSHTLYRRFPA